MKDENLKEDMDQQAENAGGFILRIAEALGVQNENIFLVPGNYDLNRISCARQRLKPRSIA